LLDPREKGFLLQNKAEYGKVVLAVNGARENVGTRVTRRERRA
jgi:hypothetical protein